MLSRFSILSFIWANLIFKVVNFGLTISVLLAEFKIRKISSLFPYKNLFKLRHSKSFIVFVVYPFRATKILHPYQVAHDHEDIFILSTFDFFIWVSVWPIFLMETVQRFVRASFCFFARMHPSLDRDSRCLFQRSNSLYFRIG